MDIGTALSNSALFFSVTGGVVAIVFRLVKPRKPHRICQEYHKKFEEHIQRQHKDNTDKRAVIISIQEQMVQFKDQISSQDKKINTIDIKLDKLSESNTRTSTQTDMIVKIVERISEKLDSVR